MIRLEQHCWPIHWCLTPRNGACVKKDPFLGPMFRNWAPKRPKGAQVLLKMSTCRVMQNLTTPPSTVSRETWDFGRATCRSSHIRKAWCVSILQIAKRPSRSLVPPWLTKKNSASSPVKLQETRRIQAHPSPQKTDRRHMPKT